VIFQAEGVQEDEGPKAPFDLLKLEEELPGDPRGASGCHECHESLAGALQQPIRSNK